MGHIDRGGIQYLRIDWRGIRIGKRRYRRCSHRKWSCGGATDSSRGRTFGRRGLRRFGNWRSATFLVNPFFELLVVEEGTLFAKLCPDGTVTSRLVESVTIFFATEPAPEPRLFGVGRTRFFG